MYCAVNICLVVMACQFRYAIFNQIRNILIFPIHRSLMPKGRPRIFDLDDAIEKAMILFWSNGYDGTTLQQLTSALGINRPSLYAAFGSKEGLFRLTLDRYRNGPASYVNRAIEKPTARQVMQSLLNGVVELVTDPERPGGCLFVGGSHPIVSGETDIGREIAERRIAGEADILNRFEIAKDNGELADHADPRLLAKFATTMLWGISVQAANGSTRRELKKLAALAIESIDGQFSK